MHVIDRGHGDPIVIVPGIQGRWEYVAPAVDAMATRFRVITFSLCDEPTADAGWRAASGIDNYAEQIAGALDARGLARAVICGISFGGLAALRFAARWPERTTALILASVPGPEWHLKPRHAWYARYPRLFGPVFAAESPLRLGREIALALPDLKSRLRFVSQMLRTLVTARIDLGRMAQRAMLIGRYDRIADCAAVKNPTLVLHGEPALDHIVDAGGTCEYAMRIRGARTVVLPRTGHLGSVTRPEAFTALIGDFVNAVNREANGSAA